MNSSPAKYTAQLIKLVQELLEELNVVQSQREIFLNDSLQGQLGIDSISRAELISRIEKTFHIELSAQSAIEAETLSDLLTLIHNAAPTLRTENISVDISPLAAVTIDPSRAASIQNVLIMHATSTPERPHMYLLDENGKEEIITYKQLLSKSQNIAHALIEHGLEQHDTVAIMLSTEPGFFYSFIGILLAGGVPVPIYPPTRANQLEEYAKREIGILNNAAARFLITFTQAKILSKFLRPFVPSLKNVLVVDDLLATKKLAPLTRGNLSDVALIQYTSGSTSQPKGVTLTHYNLLSNIRAYGKATQITSQDICISWLPLYHDLGLIGNWLGSLYYGLRLVAFSPLIFLIHPEKWLWAMHRYRGTISAGPNFAYELCVRKIEPALIEGLDLSSWRLAVNGAEMIYPKTLQGFSKKFAAYGFKPEALLPVYGLAENSLGLTAPDLGMLPRFDKVDRKLLEQKGQAIPSQSNDPKEFQELTCCGHALPDHEIRIVDEHNQPVPDRTVGHIQFCGPSSMQGYYNNPEATRELFHGGWWDTGDLGYFVENELFITGRSKDVIIKAGRNLFASEIENLVSQVTGVRQGCVIAFSVNDNEKGTDKLVIVAESTQTRKQEVTEIKNNISEKITTALEVTPDDIILVAPRSVPKTSSGKLQRNACKQLYLHNNLNKKTLPASMQLVRIFVKSFYMKMKNYVTLIGRSVYSFYIATIFTLTLLPMWLILMLAPKNIIDHAIKFWMRCICVVSFCPQKIVRQQPISYSGPIIYVANHCSYLDVGLLVGLLPAGLRFVGKRSLFNVPILKTFLTKLNHIPVDKEDSTKGIDDMNRILSMLQQGSSVLIFPEGTFSHAAGLRPFKLSAFKMAVDLNIPICPISINGTRHVLRGDSVIMKPHEVRVTMGPLFYPEGNNWADVINLKNRVRQQILTNCGEISLDFIVPDVTANKNQA